MAGKWIRVEDLTEEQIGEYLPEPVVEEMDDAIRLYNKREFQFHTVSRSSILTDAMRDAAGEPGPDIPLDTARYCFSVAAPETAEAVLKFLKKRAAAFRSFKHRRKKEIASPNGAG